MQPALQCNYTKTTAVKSDLHTHFWIQVSGIKTVSAGETFCGGSF